jgi:hypothetical protein
MKIEAAGTSETSADHTASLATRQFSEPGFFSVSLEFRAPLWEGITERKHRFRTHE